MILEGEIKDAKMNSLEWHPTTVFCEISVRTSKYCLELFINLRTAKNF